MKVLITGGRGQLGVELEREFTSPGHHQVLALGREDLDVGDRDRVEQVVGTWLPDVVVHAAAMTAVDACQTDPDLAWKTNALACRYVADAARRVGAKVLGISTDYVFDGTATRPYTEWDGTGPRSVYGASKLGGERELVGSDPDNCVVRTSWVSGVGGPNLVKTALRLLGGQGELRFVDDQIGCPTLAADLAGMVYRLAVGHRSGIWHVTNQGETSWYGLVQEIARLCGADPGRVTPIKTKDLDPQRPAPRPAYSVLDNAALRLEGVPLLPHWRDRLPALVKELQGQ